MLFPKKVKFRKSHTMRRNPKRSMIASRGVTVAFGSHGLKAMTEGRIRSNQLESSRKVIVRALGKSGKMWLRVFPDKPFTKKPPEVKLGKGKGEPVGYEVQVWPGRIDTLQRLLIGGVYRCWKCERHICLSRVRSPISGL